MGRNVVTIGLCIFASLGCANRILQGEWICTDGMSAPAGMARINFSDASHVVTSDGKTFEYSIQEDRLRILRPDGSRLEFTFQRTGESLLLASGEQRYAYVKQL